jgi:prophage regulatory protein
MKLLSPDDLLARGIPYSRSQLNRRIAAGTFPAPIKLGGADAGVSTKTAWIESEVDAWLEERVKERDTQPPIRAAA